MAKHPYYNYAKLLSYNGTYNFLVGGRGLGKTYGAKKRAIKRAITHQKQFIYLRRYKTEMVAAKATFFADMANEFRDWDFRINGNEAHAAPISTRDEKKRQWKTIGFFITLSNAQTQKSVSFPDVETIIFDEFIIEKGSLHYLPNEANVFNNFYSTVDRWQDKTRVFFLANSVTIMNPYFLEYQIRPDEIGEISTFADGFVVCHFPDSAEFATSVYETKFGKFIKDTEYAEYAVGNEFEDASNQMVKIKDSTSTYMFTLETDKGTFSIWVSVLSGEYFIQEKLPKSQRNFTMITNKVGPDKMLMLKTDKPLVYLRSAFGQGKMSFDKPSTRNAFIEVFKR